MVYGEIRTRTGSFWLAVLMHWIGNSIDNTLLSGYAGRGFVTLKQKAYGFLHREVLFLWPVMVAGSHTITTTAVVRRKNTV